MVAAFALVFMFLGAACAGIWLVTMNAKLLRHVSYGAALLALAFFAFAALAAMQAAQAQEPGPGDFGFRHDLHHDWYKELKQPGTGHSCCNGTAPGTPGDCRPTRAYKIGDRWMALIDGAYEPVPPGLVIKSDKSHEPYQAHICATRSRTIYCFIEKEGGT